MIFTSIDFYEFELFCVFGVAFVNPRRVQFVLQRIANKVFWWRDTEMLGFEVDGHSIAKPACFRPETFCSTISARRQIKV